ncbi:MAG: MBL fold metallo-hydrolase [Acidimicrobiales bacterium]|nr:MBL fold metallo-hydrolase [Acidimicrobiales bacterium]HRW39263.1 MBL fold metallo-hydrolase [Aquihabitans sp.]
MARPELRNPANAEGDWFVDERCIDCGTCREIAPHLFRAAAGASVVARQPSEAAAEQTAAWLAAQACPTTSIGTISRRPRPGRLYPLEVRDGSGVYDLRYCSEDSFGASAWLVVRPEGNVLVDSPRWTEALAGPIEALGGIAHVALTHRDDVADAHRWAERFGARSWIHRDDRRAAPWTTDEIGDDEVELQPGVTAIPVPGHTKGSVVFLTEDGWLLTGDSLAWSHERDDLTAFRGACWYSWPEQARSLGRLAERHRFHSVLPGHGARHVGGDPDDLHARLVGLVDRMAAAA